MLKNSLIREYALKQGCKARSLESPALLSKTGASEVFMLSSHSPSEERDHHGNSIRISPVFYSKAIYHFSLLDLGQSIVHENKDRPRQSRREGGPVYEPSCCD